MKHTIRNFFLVAVVACVTSLFSLNAAENFQVAYVDNGVVKLISIDEALKNLEVELRNRGVDVDALNSQSASDEDAIEAIDPHSPQWGIAWKHFKFALYHGAQGVMVVAYKANQLFWSEIYPTAEEAVKAVYNSFAGSVALGSGCA